MAELAPLPTRIVVFSLALFWGLVSIGGILVTMVKNGPIKYFQKKKRDTRPACLDDPSLGTHQFLRLKKIRMHFVASGPEGKPLMLFIHGFPEFWYSWRHQIRAFNKDYRCVAVDMRGYGETEKPKGVENYIVESMIEDFKELIEALGYEKCTLVAHDWGGSIAQTFTHSYPEMVQRLVLCNIPHPNALFKYMRSNFKQLLMSWYMFFFQLPWLPELQISSYDYKFAKQLFGKCGSSEDIEAYKWSLQLPGGLTSPINYYRAVMQYKRKAMPKTQIACPTLMVWGTQDTALAKETAGMSATYYADFTLKYIESAGHWVQMEAPDETNALIKEFLARKKI